MRAIDTNALVRLVARDDPNQVAAAEEFVQRGAWVSHIVLIEAIWVLSSVYGLRHREISTAVRMLLRHETLALQDPDVVTDALERYRQNSALGFSDCLISKLLARLDTCPSAPSTTDSAGWMVPRNCDSGSATAILLTTHSALIHLNLYEHRN